MLIFTFKLEGWMILKSFHFVLVDINWLTGYFSLLFYYEYWKSNLYSYLCRKSDLSSSSHSCTARACCKFHGHIQDESNIRYKVLPASHNCICIHLGQSSCRVTGYNLACRSLLSTHGPSSHLDTHGSLKVHSGSGQRSHHEDYNGCCMCYRNSF